MGHGTEHLNELAAEEACQHADFSDEAAALLTPEQSVPVLVQALLDAALPMDAVHAICHAIEPIESVWWAWTVATQAAGDTPTEDIGTTLSSVELFLRTRDDEFRRATEPAAETAGLDTPAGSSALAAFLSGGSMAPTTVEEDIPPPEGACAKVAAGAILLACLADPPKAGEHASRCIEQWAALRETAPPWEQQDESGVDDSGYVL